MDQGTMFILIQQIFIAVVIPFVTNKLKDWLPTTANSTPLNNLIVVYVLMVAGTYLGCLVQGVHCAFSTVCEYAYYSVPVTQIMQTLLKTDMKEIKFINLDAVKNLRITNKPTEVKPTE
jgi:hypothetical protein